MRYVFLIGLLWLAVSGCEDKKSIYETDDELIRAYLEKNNIDAIKHSSGLYYVIEKVGNGQHPTLYSNVDVLCLGYYLNGVVFQSNDAAVIGRLDSFITGWQYGIPLFSKGGKGKLFIPSYLGYNTGVLIFDIDLRNIW